MSNLEESLSHWNQIVADYRQACLLRREGRSEEAGLLLNEKLPRSIALWSKEDRRPAQEKKEVLRSMFSSEQNSIESWLLVHRTFASKLADSLIPALRQQVGEEVREVLSNQGQVTNESRRCGTAGRRSATRERIRFDDIPGVLDALLAEQMADFGPAPVFAS